MDHQTTIPGVPRKSEVVPGMAHFSGTGPAGTYCGACSEYRVGKEIDLVSEKKGKCRAYKKMMGRWGAGFDKLTPSCKYYKAKE